MNSDMMLRWYQGGRKVSSPTSQRGGKITKSTLARPGSSLGEVSAVKMDGSGWSKLIVSLTMKLAVSYLYGAEFPCHPTTSSGELSYSAAHRFPPNFCTTCTGPVSFS